MKTYELVGLGLGPFHLSLASLSEKAVDVKTLFLEKKSAFSWHPELMFEDADMQTSCLKDLVTASDPTSPYSFLNYLVENGLYYAFMNTGRLVITRKEFEVYCKWVALKLEHKISYNEEIQAVEFKDSQFIISTSKNKYAAKNISIATGHTPHYPHFIDKKNLCSTLFHAKSGELDSLDLTGKRVIIIGGGQTGLEIFSHALEGKWNKPKSVKLVSRRSNLSPLDESHFTNEYFTPQYVEAFFSIDDDKKKQIVSEQKFASDGNTPGHLRDLYQTLYLNTLHNRGPDFKILPMRDCLDIEKMSTEYKLTLSNLFIDECETLHADVVILATGFEQFIPSFLDPIIHLIHKDESQRFKMNKNFSLSWDGPTAHKIYALNFSRHGHGIAEPQTSLMAWRSAVIINDLTGQNIYLKTKTINPFVQYTREED